MRFRIPRQLRELRPARACQFLFLALFSLLFLHTEYRGEDEINAAVNAFFRADPLVLASTLLAGRSWTWLLLPALLLTGATLLLGRFFCGWICPLGTLLDLASPSRPTRAPWRLLQGRLKYWLLFTLLGSALFGLNLSGLFDPLALLLRGLTFFIHPLAGTAGREGWAGLYRLAGDRRDIVAPAYAVVRDHLLPFRDTAYPLALLSALLLGGIFLMERREPRSWCRRLCPLGTLLGLCGRCSPFRREPATLCSDCGACRQLCPTGFDHERLDPAECLLCLRCLHDCPHGKVAFRPGTGTYASPLFPERRLLLGGMAGGLLLAFPFGRRHEGAYGLLRPPGVRDEERFLALCVRCGECMKVCLKNALYPSAWQGGMEAFYTPLVIPRLGYCEYNCTLCGQVCPTGAIPCLAVEEKRRAVIGKAVFDKNHCLPFAKRVDCIVCEEHCPVPRKAIRTREVAVIDPDGRTRTIHEPYVVDDLCNGCGICENVCPVETSAGIRVHAVKDRAPLAAAPADTRIAPEGGLGYN